MFDPGVVLVLLVTVHGQVHPIGGSGCHGLGAPMARHLAKGFHVSLGRGESKLRGQGFLMMPWGLKRGRKMSSEALISPETSPQGSGGIEFVTRAISD
jgi:hypothetical protein